jgi:hypothetical protein
MTESNHLTQSKMMSLMKFSHRSLSNSMIRCKLEHVVVWNQTRRSRWVRGYQRRWVLVHRTSPAASLHGDPRRSAVTMNYGRCQAQTRVSRDTLAHQGAEEMPEYVDWDRRRAQTRRFRWASAEGNRKNLAIEEERVRFLWLGFMSHWDGAPESIFVAWEGL